MYFSETKIGIMITKQSTRYFFLKTISPRTYLFYQNFLEGMFTRHID
jgi:hypothetical protein